MDNKDVVDKFFDICRELGGRIWDIVMGFVDATGKAEFDYDFGVAFFLALIILFFVGSACWAASIAASRRYAQIPHFLLGLVFPWIYPAIILFTMEINGQKQLRLEAEQKKKAAEAAEAERQKNIALNTAAQEEQEEETSPFNAKFFEKIMRNEDGSSAGPWTVLFAGTEMTVGKIIEVLPELIVAEMIGDNGKTFTMRLPYAKMENWSDKATE